MLVKIMVACKRDWSIEKGVLGGLNISEIPAPISNLDLIADYSKCGGKSLRPGSESEAWLREGKFSTFYKGDVISSLFKVTC